MRAGARGLSLLADPLDSQVLRLLEKGPLPLIDLRKAAGLPAQTTLRKHLKALNGLGLLVRSQALEFPSAVTYELSTAGVGLRTAAESVEAWLQASPSASTAHGNSMKRTIKSLVDAWSTTILRALVAKPLSLTELDRLLPGIDYPALERRLTALRLAGLIEAVRGTTRSTPYRITRWLREAVAPLIATAGWESRHGSADDQPLDRLDMETIFLLAIPLVRIPARFKGTCELVVNFSDEKENAQTGVAVAVAGGRPVSCTSLRGAERQASALGHGSAWLSALSGGEGVGISFDGDRSLARSLVAGLRSICSNQPSERLLAA